MANVDVKDLHEGDIIAKDVHQGNTLILKSGMSLTKEIITKLSKWGFTSVEIHDEQDNDLEIEQLTNNKDADPSSVRSVPELRSIFLNNIVNVVHEYRYGISFHEPSDYQWIEDLSNSTIYKLLEKLRDWDNYSYQHSFDVFLLGSLFAKRLRIQNIESFATGCLLHDIGKLNISKSLLNKPAKLSLEEYNLMKNHTVFGYKLLKQYGFSEDIATLAKYHHERTNGSGYPESLKNDEIKEPLKILSIVDVYSALTLNLPYRKAYGSAKAEEILINECKMIGNYYFYNFFKMLGIYPLNTLVELTNGTEAKIIDINEKIPTHPTFKSINESNQIQIPLNRSIKVKKIIKF